MKDSTRIRKVFITGSPCRKGEGFFTPDAGFADKIRGSLPENAHIVLVSAAPDDASYCDYVFSSTKECIDNTRLSYRSIVMLKRSNAAQAEKILRRSDLIILCGGHVPTQNRFFQEIALKDILPQCDAVVIGCSAGSMNAADFVYSHPELPGESIDPDYSRTLRGLALTDINIVPHYEDVRYALLDGRRLYEDIIFPDSWCHPFYTFKDGVYIECTPDGRKTLYGEAWVIENGSIRKITEQNQTYQFMNAIFISPHFPSTYSHFCAGLKADGVNVLGIADCPYEQLSEELRSSLTEYYRVDNLEDYNQVYRAVAFFAFKYGKIDWIESNNEYWLEQDARLRTDFNVTTGIQNDRIAAIKNKSEMKKYYAVAKVPTARQIKASEGLKAVLEFASQTGWPIIAKPDNGVGADGTFKLENEADVKAFFDGHKANYGAFVVEEFITGLLVSYDAIYNSKSEPLFESMGVYPTPIMDIVHGNLDSDYYVDKAVPAALSDAGRRTVKAFGIKSRFVHLEFFKLDRDREGLGKKGDYVGLEVNMRPAGGFTPDMMNFAHSTDVFKIWADMVAFDTNTKEQGQQYYCAYASRRFNREYLHSEAEIMEKYGELIVMHQQMPVVLAGALGDYFYMARLDTKKQVEDFFKFISA